MNLESLIRFLSKPYLDYSKPVIKGGAIPIILYCDDGLIEGHNLLCDTPALTIVSPYEDIATNFGCGKAILLTSHFPYC